MQKPKIMKVRLHKMSSDVTRKCDSKRARDKSMSAADVHDFAHAKCCIYHFIYSRSYAIFRNYRSNGVDVHDKKISGSWK